MHSKVQRFIKSYQLFQEDEIQQIQLAHRYSLVDAFQIKEGMRVLEIGCGQGDTTVVLADAVGPTGHITAIDIARGDYGAPTTLAQAHALILHSTLGERITFHLETDFLTFDMDEYDIIVMSHCSWYFESKELLEAYFKKMKNTNAIVCLAEWDMAFETLEQRSHFCAVSILALYSAFVTNDGNIQNVFSKQQLAEVLERVGLNIVKETIVEASFLQDGTWEKGYANYIAPEFVETPSPIQAIVQTYYDVMNSVEEVESLNSFVLIAK